MGTYTFTTKSAQSRYWAAARMLPRAARVEYDLRYPAIVGVEYGGLNIVERVQSWSLPWVGRLRRHSLRGPWAP